jgi:hypothetical protein
VENGLYCKGSFRGRSMAAEVTADLEHSSVLTQRQVTATPVAAVRRAANPEPDASQG